MLVPIASNFLVSLAPAGTVLQPGAVLRALVLQAPDDLTVRLAVAGGTIDVASKVPLAPGTQVTLAVAGSSARPTVTLTPLSAPLVSQAEAALGVQAIGPASMHALAPASSGDASAVLAPAADLQSVVAAVAPTAAAQQGGLAPLYANLGALAGGPVPIPAAVRDAIQHLLAQRMVPATDGSVRAGDVRLALMRAGLTIDGEAEAGLLEQGGLKFALLSLRRALSDWIEADGEEPASPDVPASARSPVPMPPYRSGPTVPQAPAIASISPEASPRKIAGQLLTETDAALARDTLLRIASMPEDGGGMSRASGEPIRVTFDIPFVAAGGIAVAQIRIERDDAGPRGANDTAPAWRAMFSVAFEPIGPVHARVAVSGERVAVTLHAERNESARCLRDGLTVLEMGLREAALELGSITCQGGTPTAPRLASGQFLDHST